MNLKPPTSKNHTSRRSMSSQALTIADMNKDGFTRRERLATHGANESVLPSMRMDAPRVLYPAAIATLHRKRSMGAVRIIADRPATIQRALRLVCGFRVEHFVEFRCLRCSLVFCNIRKERQRAKFEIDRWMLIHRPSSTSISVG
jgi:hypothetical protein